MEMIPVDSSNLHSVGYDSTNQILRVRFLSGDVYDYFNVPEHLFNGLLSADSKGSYLHRYIKPYPYTKL